MKTMTFDDKAVGCSVLLQQLLSLEMDDGKEGSSGSCTMTMESLKNVHGDGLIGFVQICSLSMESVDAEHASLGGQRDRMTPDTLCLTLNAANYFQANRKWYNNLSIAIRAGAVDVGDLTTDLVAAALQFRVPAILNAGRRMPTDYRSDVLEKLSTAVMSLKHGVDGGVEGPGSYSVEGFAAALTPASAQSLASLLINVARDADSNVSCDATIMLIAELYSHHCGLPTVGEKFIPVIKTPFQLEYACRRMPQVTAAQAHKLIMGMIAKIATREDADHIESAMCFMNEKLLTYDFKTNVLMGCWSKLDWYRETHSTSSKIRFGTGVMLLCGAMFDKNPEATSSLLRTVCDGEPSFLAMAMTGSRTGPASWSATIIDPEKVTSRTWNVILHAASTSDEWSGHPVWLQASDHVFAMAADVLAKPASGGVTPAEHSKRAALLRLIGSMEQCYSTDIEVYVKSLEDVRSRATEPADFVSKVWKIVGVADTKEKPDNELQHAAEILAMPERDGLKAGVLPKRAMLLRILEDDQCVSTDPAFYLERLQNLLRDKPSEERKIMERISSALATKTLSGRKRPRKNEKTRDDDMLDDDQAQAQADDDE